MKMVLLHLVNLPYGTYYFKEIEAPDGYIMDGQEHEFSIVENNDLIEAVSIQP